MNRHALALLSSLAIACGDVGSTPLDEPDASAPIDVGIASDAGLDAGVADVEAPDTGAPAELTLVACEPPDPLPRSDGISVRDRAPGLQVVVLARDFGPTTTEAATITIEAAGASASAPLPPSGCLEAPEVAAPATVRYVGVAGYAAQHDVPLSPRDGALVAFSEGAGSEQAPTVDVSGTVEITQDELGAASRGFAYTASGSPFAQIPSEQPTREDGTSARSILINPVGDRDYRFTAFAHRFEGVTVLMYRQITRTLTRPVLFGLRRLSGVPGGRATLDVTSTTTPTEEGSVLLGPAIIPGAARNTARLLLIDGDPELTMWIDPSYVPVPLAGGVEVALTGAEPTGPFEGSVPGLLVYESLPDTTFTYRVHRAPVPNSTVEDPMSVPANLSFEPHRVQVDVDPKATQVIIQGWDANAEAPWARVTLRSSSGGRVSLPWSDEIARPAGPVWIRVLTLQLEPGEEPDRVDQYAVAKSASQRWFQIRP